MYKTRVDLVASVAVSPAVTHVATLKPPPGDYLVTAFAEAVNSGGPALDVACDLDENTNNGTLLSTSWAQDDDGSTGSVVLRNVVSLTNANDTLDVYCQTVDFQGSDNFVEGFRLTATKSARSPPSNASLKSPASRPISLA